MEVNNLTTKLGKTWTKKILKVMDIAREYAERYKLPVTQRGGYNLNGLMLGNDKIQLTHEFGRYLFVLAMETNKEYQYIANGSLSHIFEKDMNNIVLSRISSIMIWSLGYQRTNLIKVMLSSTKS